MKTFIFILFLTSSVFGYPLLSGQRVPGFEPDRQFKFFVVDSSGQMTMRIRDAESNKTRLESVGKLSPFTLKKLRADIAGITAATPLVDSDPGGPECIDPPEYQVNVYIRGKLKPIYRSANCHEWRLENFKGWKSIELTKGFLEL